MASVDVSIGDQPSPAIKPYVYTEKEYNIAQFKTKLLNFREEDAYTDIIIKAQDVEMACHKVILAASSPYFHNLFQSAESTSGKVVCNDICPRILEDLIKFLYTGKIQITAENVKDLCQSCNEFKLEHLKKAADRFLSDMVEPANCLGLYVFAKAQNIALTQKAAFTCMLTKPQDVLRLALDSEYQAMSEKALVEYISDDDLEAEDEALVFQLVDKWVKVDQGNRANAFENIFQYVRLPFCSQTFLCDIEDECPYADTKKCRQYIREALKYQAAKREGRSTVNTPRTQPRKSTKEMHLMTSSMTSTQQSPGLLASSTVPEEPIRKNKETLVLFGGRIDQFSDFRGLCFLEENEKTWKEVSVYPTEHCFQAAACVLGEEIVVTGGRPANENKDSDETWLYNIRQKSWTSLPRIKIARSFHVMLSVKGCFYICGGYNGKALESCEMLDTRRQQWDNIAELLKATQEAAGVVLGDHIYILGGTSTPRLTQKYDQTKKTWEAKADIPVDINDGPSAAVARDKIYVVGSEENHCVSYCPLQDQWTTLSNSPEEKHCYGACAAWRGRLVVGGGWDKTSCATIEMFDPDFSEWFKMRLALPQRLSGHCLMTAPLVQ